MQLTLNCVAEIMSIDVSYPRHDNWFGIVFNSEMFGDALVFTNGKSTETQTETPSLRLYEMTGSAAFLVTHNADRDWTQVEL
eukprot:CAMPEP_0202716310 /NCGR_PEP_ID=MMETSP1385-20130828/100183_1 /ASSEMBLY_ACC=CAM_ASM_000861 /TAXON_ID=933848 /ORGANISM="Elphidium margaritaceum" /LENGTH=81 /DNA_ID=CAMNT_0049378003 /DNA_START=1 /DNA_END=243 /DNA_ORIENTATION=+